MGYTLGLDLGPTSIGWALLDFKEEYIIDAGVRIFEEGVENMDQKQEMSKNASRREKRQIRRQTWRRKKRRRQLRSKLWELDMMPKDDLDDFFAMNPYPLREKALYEKLTPYEIGRIFYHLNERRGYKSNRIESLSDKEEGAIYDGSDKSGARGISELRKAIAEGGFKTLGEYLNSLNPHDIRIRNRYTERDMFVEEFDSIWEIQKQFYPELLNDENYKDIRDRIIFYQRPLKSQKNRRGYCKFEKNKRRAARFHPTVEEFVMHQQLNSIRVIGGDRIDDDRQKLTNREREILLKELETKGQVTFKKMRKLLQLNGKEYKINVESQEKIDGLKFYSKLKKAIGKDFDKYDDEELFKMWNTLHFAKEPEWLLDYARKTWGFEGDKLEKFCKIKFPKTYAKLSLKAIRNILPYLKEGLIYSDAAERAGYDHSLLEEKPEILEKLPTPENVANPLVNQTLHQLKKVVNEIIDVYGKPEEIRVEMARDLKLSREHRLKILIENRAREKEADEIKKILTKEGLVDVPTRNDIKKYKLWVECNETCPYTGKKIGLHQLYNGEVDIEHIIPYSRSLDSSFNNLSLCFREENEIKGNKTPYEAYGGDTERFEEMKYRLKDTKMQKPKVDRFLAKKLDPNEFISRKLNDTRYISKVAKNYMKHLTENVNVATGQTTATLRRFWGLNAILARDNEDEDLKNREDHRHHAVDAIAIAATSRAALKRLSDAHSAYGMKEEKLVRHFPPPWEGFYIDVEYALQKIIVSRRVNRKVRGQMHEDTFYGMLKDNLGNQKQNKNGVPLYTVRKPIENMKAKQIRNIIDEKVKDAIYERLYEFGVDVYRENKNNFGLSSAEFNKKRNEAFAEPVFLNGIKSGKKTPIKKARIEVASSNMFKISGYNKWVEPGSNHHVEIYADEDGTQKGEIVTLFEAYRRKREGEPIIKTNHGPNKEFVCSLQINEAVLWGEVPEAFDPEDKATYGAVFDKVFRVQKSSKAQMNFRTHNTAITNDYDRRCLLQKSPSKFFGTKILISPAGFIEYADD